MLGQNSCNVLGIDQTRLRICTEGIKSILSKYIAATGGGERTVYPADMNFSDLISVKPPCMRSAFILAYSMSTQPLGSSVILTEQEYAVK